MASLGVPLRRIRSWLRLGPSCRDQPARRGDQQSYRNRGHGHGRVREHSRHRRNDGLDRTRNRWIRNRRRARDRRSRNRRHDHNSPRRRRAELLQCRLRGAAPVQPGLPRSVRLLSVSRRSAERKPLVYGRLLPDGPCRCGRRVRRGDVRRNRRVLGSIRGLDDRSRPRTRHGRGCSRT